MIVPATRAWDSSGTPGPTIVTGVPAARSRAELDREDVHRHRADDRPRLAVDEHRRPRQVAAEAVGVADRHEPDPRVALGDERGAVAGRLAGVQELRERRARFARRAPARARRRRGRSERRQAVERDSAARRVEMRLRETQGGRAVRSVPRETGIARGRLAKSRQLAAREVEIAVGGGEMRHQADHLARRRPELGDSPAPHAGVELHVHRQPLGDRGAGSHLQPGLPRRGDLRRRRRAEHDDPRLRQLACGARAPPRASRRRARSRRRRGPPRRSRPRRGRTRRP